MTVLQTMRRLNGALLAAVLHLKVSLAGAEIVSMSPNEGCPMSWLIAKNSSPLVNLLIAVRVVRGAF